MAVKTGSGAKIYVSTASVLKTVDTLSEFQALTFTKVGEVGNLGDFGDESKLVTWTNLEDSRDETLKGSRNAGMLPLMCGWDPLDAGQAALITYEQTNFEYAFKIDMNDAPSELYSSTLKYFRGIVSSQRISNKDANGIRTITFNVPINSQIYTAPAALIP